MLKNIPWWVILIIALVVVLLLMFLPLHKFYDKRRNKQQSLKVKAKVIKNPHKTFSFKEYASVMQASMPRWQNLVYVPPLKDSCLLCRPFENKILIWAKTSEDYTTMEQALKAGYHHIGCRHQDLVILNEKPQATAPQWTNKAQNYYFKLRLKQLKYEEALRRLHYQLKNALSQKNKIKLKKALALKEASFQAFCAENNLKRNYHREKSNDFINCWK